MLKINSWLLEQKPDSRQNYLSRVAEYAVEADSTLFWEFVEHLDKMWDLNLDSYYTAENWGE